MRVLYDKFPLVELKGSFSASFSAFVDASLVAHQSLEQYIFDVSAAVNDH